MNIGNIMKVRTVLFRTIQGRSQERQWEVTFLQRITFLGNFRGRYASRRGNLFLQRRTACPRRVDGKQIGADAQLTL